MAEVIGSPCLDPGCWIEKGVEVHNLSSVSQTLGLGLGRSVRILHLRDIDMGWESEGKEAE